MIRYSALLFALIVSSCQRAPIAVTAYSPQFTADKEMVQRGQEILLTGPCVMCHTIRGTVALGRVGPDLTHVASRKTIAAGTLPNTRGHLAGWILNPQNLKPGSRMPPTLLSGDDLHALLAFLETLK
jgi:cytochrome c oxidase subunit II